MPNKKKYKYDIVAEQILEEIKKGRWKIGDKLPPESKLVEEFEVSRVCLRESLKKLNVLGILDIIQGDGTYISEINPEKFMEPLFSLMSVSETSIQDIYDARIFLESGACVLAAKRRTEEDLKKLRKMLERMDESISFNDSAAFSKYDQKYHEAIVGITQNKILIMLMGMFKSITTIYTNNLNQNVKVIYKSMLDHRELYYAIEEKNDKFAGQIMSAHLERSRDILTKALLP
ncbi:MAG: FadR/GntR family transcriptional regulator [Hespellia sp.]|nr:FadR/GntR family transcriptional regulator [Hespellia sp.]